MSNYDVTFLASRVYLSSPLRQSPARLIFVYLSLYLSIYIYSLFRVCRSVKRILIVFYIILIKTVFFSFSATIILRTAVHAHGATDDAEWSTASRLLPADRTLAPPTTGGSPGRSHRGLSALGDDLHRGCASRAAATNVFRSGFRRREDGIDLSGVVVVVIVIVIGIVIAEFFFVFHFHPLCTVFSHHK